MYRDKCLKIPPQSSRLSVLFPFSRKKIKFHNLYLHFCSHYFGQIPFFSGIWLNSGRFSGGSLLSEEKDFRIMIIWWIKFLFFFPQGGSRSRRIGVNASDGLTLAGKRISARTTSSTRGGTTSPSWTPSSRRTRDWVSGARREYKSEPRQKKSQFNKLDEISTRKPRGRLKVWFL